ncbi:MAG: energy transducer TonB [Smithellaceae bacterium]|nr:energy transducer TonB [Smithellaceae bacterium]
MNQRRRAFNISVLIHGVLILAAIQAGQIWKGAPHLRLINFDVSQGTARSGVTPAKAPERIVSSPTAQVSPAPPQIAEQKQVPPPQVQAESEVTAPMDVSPAPPQTPSYATSRTPAAQVFASASRGEGASGTDDPARGKSSLDRYLAEHFSYIRDKIQRNIVFPAVAQRMGWQGKVILAFIITSDGAVKDLKITRSSGYPILDRCAVNTVRDTAPFPRPPLEAQLVMPVVFKLRD